MSFSSFPSVERASHFTSNRNDSDGDATMNVTEQFKFMHVSGESNTNDKHVEELARSFMVTLGIQADDSRYSDQLSALTRQMSGMMKPSGTTDQAQTKQTRSASDDGFPPFSTSEASQSPKDIGIPPRSPNVNDSRRSRSPRRPRSRSRTPIGSRLKEKVDDIRSKSPFRKNEDRSRSPIPACKDKPTESMAMDAETDEFFEAHTSMDSFMVNSPIPKPVQKPSTQSNGISPKRQPTPVAPERPPLASVNISEANTQMGNSPIISPQWQSTFKFDKEQDKFNVGTSPPKKSKLGSPRNKVRSPSERLRPLTSPLVQPNIQPDFSPLQGSPLSESDTEPSPSPYKPSTKPQTNHAYPSSQVMGGTPSLFTSPVPNLFHAPDTFIRRSGTRSIPSPHNIMQGDPQSEAATRRQTAPPNMATNAATTSDHFNVNVSVEPKTPFDRYQGTTSIPKTAPDTAETLIKKKTRNTATPPNMDAVTSQMFNVDLSRDATKPKGNRGNTLRKGFNVSTKTTGSSTFVFGLDGINEVETDDKAPIAKESPSNFSTVSMDTTPFFSPPPQQNLESRTNVGDGIPQGFNAPAQFNLNLGVQPQPGLNLKSRSKRKDSKGRRAPFPRSQSTRVAGPSRSTFDLNHDRIQKEEELLKTKTRLEITALKEEGKKYYLNAKYQESTRVYSKAIEKYKLELFAYVPSKDLLAVLLSNRAASLLMIGAYESAAEDCRNGIHFVTDPRNKNPDLDSPDANPALRPKLYTRMARSYLKLGKVDDADRAFSEAVESATVIQDFHKRENIVGMHSGLEQIKTEAILGRTDVLQLRKLLDRITRLEKQSRLNSKTARDQALESLCHVNIALTTANGCYELHEAKLKLLAGLKRWREVTNHCERFAASNMKYDGCLVGDLSSKNPFPGVPNARYLRANHFGDTKEDELKGAEMLLDKKSAPEALLRLPYFMMPYYLRSLRLNERYNVAVNCLSKLDKYLAETATAASTKESIYDHFLWLTEERDKLHRTKTERELADNMFSNAEYEKAAKGYAQCLVIDAEGKASCAGGRLHAILHCNRAACFMAVKRYRDAFTECTAALRIYPRYLKALLRRARCYSRLERTREADHDYKHWLEIVKHSRESKSNAVLSDCVFDGPHTVKAKDVKDVQEELKDLLQASARAEAEERARKARNSYQEQSRKHHSEQFYYSSSNNTNGKKSPAHENAHRRRENFYSSQNSSRRWDSFKEQSKQKHEKTNSQKNKKKDKDNFGYKSQSRDRTQSPRENNSHYSALGINRKANEEEIKKAYKKMALKYHPDKNQDNPTAADNFLRIKDAYEILKDRNARRKYDSESRRNRF